jgi:hypothetical protein
MFCFQCQETAKKYGLYGKGRLWKTGGSGQSSVSVDLRVKGGFYLW